MGTNKPLDAPRNIMLKMVLNARAFGDKFISTAFVSALFVSIVFGGCNHHWSSDRSAVAFLKTIMTAQSDFRSNDRDDDGAENFWIEDVAGLYGIDPGNGPIKLIDQKIAQADRTPARRNYAWVMEKKQVIGYYFGALTGYREEGKSISYDDGTGRNPLHFGLIAFPAEEGADEVAIGTLTFITNEKGTIYSKNTGGKPVWEFPEDPIAEGWKVHVSYGPVGEGGVQVVVEEPD